MNSYKKTYAFQINNRSVLNQSASGGFFHALCCYVIGQGGIVFGAAFSEHFQVKHIACENLNDCVAFSGSKYVQSNLGDTFRYVKQQLDTGRQVCFSGTGCQVAGLHSFLRKEYVNLITVDLVCAGVPSPDLWKKYIEYQENKYMAPVIHANFRNKTFGYQCSTMTLQFANGKNYSYSGRIDPMMQFFVSGIAKRPSCYQCGIKGLDRKSDFTIYDSWHAEELTGHKVNDRGFTNIIVHSQKAENILEELKTRNDVFVIDTGEAKRLDGVMIDNYPEKHPCRDEFYHTLKDEGIEACINRYHKVNNTDLIIEKCKPILYKTGIINKVKKMKRELKKIKVKK